MRQGDILQACYDLLDHASVTGLLSASYGVSAIFQRGRVPRDDAGDARYFPYITYWIVADGDYSDKSALGGDAVVQVDIWDRSGSELTTAALMRAVSLRIVRQTWAITGFIDCAREMSEIMDDPDGLTKHGEIRARVTYID